MSAAEIAVLKEAADATQAATPAESSDSGCGRAVENWPDGNMLEAAMGLLCNASPIHQPEEWEHAKQRWMDAYHRQLAELYRTDFRARGAVIEVIERCRTQADLEALDDGVGVIVPNEIRLNGQPLLITEDGPVIEEISCAEDGKAGLVKVRMTVLARRVVIDAEGPAE